MKEGIYIKKSMIEGVGVFTARDFRKGEKICTMKGRKTSIAAIQKAYHKGDKRITCDTFQIAERTYIILDKLHNSINHSCNPNAGVKGIDTLMALKNIKKGQEITFDYSTTEWTPQDYKSYDPNQWPLECKCGYRYCRKKVKCFPALPKYTKTKYIKSRILQDFIFRQLSRPKEQTRCYICETS